MTFEPRSLLYYSRPFYLSMAVLYMGGIYILSSIYIPFEDIPHPDLLGFCANMFHLPLYTGLGLVLLMGLRAGASENGPWIVGRTVFLSLLILAAYGAFDEYHQSWTGRTPSVMDFLVNLCGGTLAVCLTKYFLEKAISKRKMILWFTGISMVAAIFAFIGMF